MGCSWLFQARAPAFSRRPLPACAWATEWVNRPIASLACCAVGCGADSKTPRASCPSRSGSDTRDEKVRHPISDAFKLRATLGKKKHGGIFLLSPAKAGELITVVHIEHTMINQDIGPMIVLAKEIPRIRLQALQLAKLEITSRQVLAVVCAEDPKKVPIDARKCAAKFSLCRINLIFCRTSDPPWHFQGSKDHQSPEPADLGANRCR